MTTYIPHAPFPRTDSTSASTEPHAFGRLDLCGSNIVRLVGFPLDVLEGLQPALRGDDGRGVLQVKKYTNEKGERTAVLTLLGKPWTTDSGNVSTDILLTVICGHLHKHLFSPTTGLPPPKSNPPVHLSITFKRPLRVAANVSRTQSVFAVSLPTPTQLRTVSVPEADEQTVITEILRLWGGEIRDYRPLPDGCYEMRLKSRARLRSSGGGDNHTPLSALIEYLHSKRLPLIHSFHFHSKTAYPDFFLFDCPDGPLRKDVEQTITRDVLTAQANYADPYAVAEKKAKVVREVVRGPPTVQPKQGIMGRGFAFLRGRRSSNPTPAAQQVVAVMVPDVRSRHSLDSKRDASSFYAAGRAESFMTRRNSEGQATKQVPDIVVTQNGHLSPGIHGNGLLPAGSHSPRSGRSGGVTPQTVLSQTTTDRKSKGKSIEIEEVPDVDSNANGWGGGFVGEPAEDSNDLKDKQKEKSKGKEKARKNGRDKHKNAQGDLPGIHQTMDNPAGKEGKEGGASTGDNGWGWGGAGSGDAANGDTGGGWGGTGEAIGGVGGGGWGNTAEPDPAGASHSNGNGWGVSEDSPGAEPSKWDTGTAVTIHHVETDVKSVKSAMSSDTSKTTAAASKALVPPKPADGPLVPVGNQQVGPKREKSKSKSGKENRKTPNGAEPPNPPNPNNWTGPSAQSWNAATGPYQGGKGTVIATRYNPSGSQSSKSPYWQPSEAVRDMDPRKGIQDVGGIVQGVYVPATRHLPAVIEVNPMPVGSKKPSGAGGLFGPNLPTPEIAEKMRKEAEEKALAEKKKMDEALMHAKWAEAVREGVKADMERQIFLQQNGINLEDYFRRHPERTWTGQVQEPRWPAQQAPVQPKGKGKKKQDQYPDYGVQYQDPAYAGYSYDPGQTGPMEYANNNWGQTEGYGYPGEYAQDHVPHQKGKKKKGGQARQDQQQGWPLDGNAYGDAGGGQQPWYADQPNANVWAQPGPTEQHKGSKNPGKKSKPGKNKRNFRDEEVDPYVLNGQGGWNAAAADPHQNPAGHGHQENGWGGGGAHGETGQTNWGQAAGGSTRGDGNAWGSGRHGNEPAQAWADEGRANADKGKKKSGGFMSKVKALFGGGKKKDEGWGWGDNNSGWPTANTQNGPAVNVQTEMTYAQQPQNMDWGGWPVADTGGAGGGGGGWDQQAAEHQANGHGHQHTKPGPAAHTNGYSGPAKGYGAPSVHHAQNGGWSGAQPAASVHHGQGGWGQGASSVHQGQGGGWGDQAAGSAHRGQGGWGGTQAAASVHHGQGGWGGAQPAGPAAPAWPQPGGHGTAEDQKWAAAAVYQHPAAAAMQAHGQAPAPEDQKWGAAAYQHPAAATMQAHGHAAPPQGHVREPAGYYNQGFPENALVDSDEESDDGPMGLAALESLGGMGGMGAENQMASLLEKLNHVQQERAGGVGGGGGGGKALRRKATGRPRH